MNWVEVLVLLFIFQAIALFTATAVLTKQSARAKAERDAWLHGFHYLVSNPQDVAGALQIVQDRLDESIPFIQAVKVLGDMRRGV